MAGLRFPVSCLFKVWCSDKGQEDESFGEEGMVAAELGSTWKALELCAVVTKVLLV